MTVNITDIAGMVRNHRKRAGLTQKGLADLAGIGKATVFDIEKGKNTVRLINLVRVLEVLNISVEFRSPLIPKKRGEK